MDFTSPVAGKKWMLGHGPLSPLFESVSFPILDWHPSPCVSDSCEAVYLCERLSLLIYY